MSVVIPNHLQQFLLSDRADHAVVVSSRRAGFTFGLALKALAWAECHPGAEIWYTAPYEGTVSHFLSCVGRILRSRPFSFQQLRSSTSEITKTHTLAFRNGSRIKGVVQNPSAFPDPSADALPTHLLADLVFHQDPDFVQHILDLVGSSQGHSFLGKTGCLLGGTRPLDVAPELPWYTPLFRMACPEFCFPVTTNPDFSSAECDSFQKEVSELVWRTEYLCEWATDPSP